MKSILILAHDFPPYNSIGAQRPYSWYRYFSKFNWYPVVICSASKNAFHDKSFNIADESTGIVKYVTLKEHNHKFLIVRKVHTLLKLLFGFFIKRIDTRYKLYLEAFQYLSEKKVDLILVTGEPFILFVYAAQLSKRFNIPWVADYRDGWSTNYTALYRAGTFTQLYYKYLRIIEKNVLKNVSMITTTCYSQRDELIKIHKKAQVEIVFNGFFEDLIQKAIKPQNKQVFTLVYGGTIYPFQKLEIFLAGYKQFIQDIKPKDVIVKFIGIDFFNDQTDRILSYDKGLNKYIEIINRMPLEKALENMSEANVLLLLGDSEIKQLYAKVFDYIALNRKILFVVGDNSNVSQILNETNTGLICHNEKDVFSYLKSCYEIFKDIGYVPCKTENLNYYSREFQAQKMIAFLNSIIK